MTFELSEFELDVLDCFWSDHECVGTILMNLRSEHSDVTQLTIAKTVYKLWELEMLVADCSQPVDKDTLFSEPPEYEKATYWFRLTAKGAAIYEEGLKVLKNDTFDWNASYSGLYSYKNKQGYVDGTSKDVCLNEILEFNKTEKEWQVDMDSFVYSKIKGFRPHYWKYIEGGHRISFKLINKKHPDTGST
jgi:hypothetical protein